MRLILLLGFFCVVSVNAAQDKVSVCYKAKTCIHNAKEKCGADKDDGPRRFFDTCDMLEFNCLRSKNYVRVSRSKCESLPPLDPAKRKH